VTGDESGAAPPTERRSADQGDRATQDILATSRSADDFVRLDELITVIDI
jgi:hypothetical protein